MCSDSNPATYGKGQELSGTVRALKLFTCLPENQRFKGNSKNLCGPGGQGSDAAAPI